MAAVGPRDVMRDDPVHGDGGGVERPIGGGVHQRAAEFGGVVMRIGQLPPRGAKPKCAAYHTGIHSAEPGCTVNR